MERAVNRQWRIVRRPVGLAQPADFEWTEAPVPHPGPDEALVQNKLLSLDPTNRPWMWERETYLPPQNLGDVMRGICVGNVIESSNPALRVGTPIYGIFGWQDYAIVGPNDLVAPLPEDPTIPLTAHLGLFGHIGMTASGAWPLLSTQLYRLDYGSQAGRDSPEAFGGSDSVAGRKQEAVVKVDAR